jgi:hypothetical protein
MGFDCDPRPQLFCYDYIGEQREADAGPLDAHQFVEQGKPVEPHPAGRKKIAAFEARVSGLGHPERHVRCEVPRPRTICLPLERKPPPQSRRDRVLARISAT